MCVFLMGGGCALKPSAQKLVTTSVQTQYMLLQASYVLYTISVMCFTDQDDTPVLCITCFMNNYNKHVAHP